MLLQKRSNHMYYFRWVCPPKIRKVVGRRELIRSLRTSDQLVAKARASGYYRLVHRLNHLLRMNNLTDDEFNSLVAKIWDRLSLPLHKDLSLIEVAEQGGPVEWREWLESDLGELQYMFDREEGRYVSHHREWPELFTQVGLEPSCYTEQDQERIYQKLLDMRYTFHLERLKQLERFYEGLPQPGHVPPSNGNEDDGTPRFSEVYKAFIEDKIKESQLSEKMQADYRRFSSDLIDIMGDFPVGTLTRERFRDFLLKDFRRLPARNKSPYQMVGPDGRKVGRPAKELLAMDVPDEDRISDSVVDDMRKFMQGVYKFAVRQKYVSASPLSGLELNLDLSETYGAFSHSQIRKMLEMAAHEDAPWRKWIIWIGAYSGARLGEIVQLRKEDFKLDEDSGRRFFAITEEAGSTKTKSSNRLVPVHPKLIEAGLLEFVARTKGRLFPDLKSHVVTGWMPRFRKSCNVPDTDIEGRRLVFHSFRHTVVSTLRSKGVVDPPGVRIVVAPTDRR